MKNICVLGLGYVGLPLAVEFAKHYKTVGFDTNQSRIDELKSGVDNSLEVSGEELKTSKLSYSASFDEIRACNIYIVAVPTPVDKHNAPDVRPLLSACSTVGSVLGQGDLVIFESTVYPGLTEEVCVPKLEEVSGLVYNKGFFCGYSPERINPGDKVHTLTKIKKVTSGSNPEAAQKVNELYKSIITAGTHLAPSIKVAEAAKVIENSQRDINIAFVNELAKVFSAMGIDTNDVLEAAGTKWNFLPFKPGLVGGHCIGVDPYYLAQKAKEAGYHPEIILAGRRLNDNMGKWIAGEVVKLLIKKGHTVKNAKVLAMGITFKENCPDIRNSKAVDVIDELVDFGCNVEVYDPWADVEQVKHEFNVDLIQEPGNDYTGIVLLVSHNEFVQVDPRSLTVPNSVVFDVKGIWDKEAVDKRL